MRAPPRNCQVIRLSGNAHLWTPLDKVIRDGRWPLGVSVEPVTMYLFVCQYCLATIARTSEQLEILDEKEVADVTN